FGLLIAWLGVSPLTEAVRQRWFWMKGAYTLSLAVGALMLVAALSRPGRTSRWAPVVIGAALAAILAMGSMQMMRTPAEARMAVWVGHTAMVCPWRIVAIAGPVFILLIWAMRGL